MTGSSREFYGTGTNFFRYRYRYFFPGPNLSATGTGTIQKGAKFPGPRCHSLVSGFSRSFGLDAISPQAGVLAILSAWQLGSLRILEIVFFGHLAIYAI